MSRVGQQPIGIPEGVTAACEGASVRIQGPLGELAVTLPGGITAAVEDSRVVMKRPDDSIASRGFHGLARSLVANMVVGVTKGYRKDLEINGTGFRAAVQGNKVVMSLGFSSPIEYTVPEGVKVMVEGGTAVTVTGPDKQKVGDVAARLRSFYPAEPYKGKGVQYKGEHVRRKVGKTVA